MNSQNWRVRPDSSAELKSKDNNDHSKSRRSFRPMPEYNVQSSWTAAPGMADTEVPYRGGYNPTRPAGMDPIRRPTSDLAIRVDPKAHQAIDQGRRLYVGNLPYKAMLQDIQAFFSKVQDSIEDISMSVDPMTGRNPSYCFMDFVNEDVAQKVMRDYDGQIFMNRPLKVGRGVKSGTSTQSRRFHLQTQPRKDDSNVGLLKFEMRERPMAFDRWRRLDDQFNPDDHNDSVLEEKRRLFVGGLPRFPNQVEANVQVQDLFKGFKVEVVSKMISPPHSVQAEAGNHYYCFVDMATSEEAARAVKVLNGVKKWNWNITVSPSTKKSGKLTERQRIYVNGLPYFTDSGRLREEMEKMFEPFGEIKFISRLFEEDERQNKLDGVSGNWYYCYVELADGKQVDAALEKLGSRASIRAG